MSELEIKITTEANEIRAAQRLRFEVFNVEMNKGLHASYEKGLDVDEFDPFCDHLIVRHRSSREIVGTYRLLRGSQAQKNIGFYSEREFDLRKIKRLRGELLELGRSCARKDFRDKPLIPLMWEAIAGYVKTHGIRYLFGCASLYATDAREVGDCFSLLKRKHYAGEDFRVEPVAACRFDGLHGNEHVGDEQATFLKLPSLIKGYLRLGAVVCGPPALDRDFGTADFLLLLDVQKLSTDYLRRFGLLGSKVRDAVG
jgi:putative hemolysin